MKPVYEEVHKNQKKKTNLKKFEASCLPRKEAVMKYVQPIAFLTSLTSHGATLKFKKQKESWVGRAIFIDR